MALLQWPSSPSTPAFPALKSSQCSVMRPPIGPCRLQRPLPRQDQGAIFGARSRLALLARPVGWQLHRLCASGNLWCASACLRRLLFSRRLGQDVWRQALSRLIRRRPSAGWAARRCPPAGGSTESRGWKVHLYYIWSRSAGLVCSCPCIVLLLPSVLFLLCLLCWYHDATLNQQTMKR